MMKILILLIKLKLLHHVMKVNWSINKWIFTWILLIQQFSHQPLGEPATPSPEEAEITNAAVVGTRAFFQISVNEGKDAWLNRFCAASTESGCALVRMGADRLWQKYQEAKAEVQAEVDALDFLAIIASCGTCTTA